jgi:hypothetical protein
VANPNFLLFSLLKKITFDPWRRKLIFGPWGRRQNSWLRVTHLSAADLGSEVPGRAQQGIRGGADVAGISEPRILTPRYQSRNDLNPAFTWMHLYLLFFDLTAGRKRILVPPVKKK